MGRVDSRVRDGVEGDQICLCSKNTRHNSVQEIPTDTYYESIH